VKKWLKLLENMFNKIPGEIPICLLSYKSNINQRLLIFKKGTL